MAPQGQATGRWNHGVWISDPIYNGHWILFRERTTGASGARLAVGMHQSIGAAVRRMTQASFTGSCLCGDLRWRASAPPYAMGLCFCADCRKASGSGFIPFMNFDASARLTITGRWTVHRMTHARWPRGGAQQLRGLRRTGVRRHLGRNRQPHHLCRVAGRSVSVQAQHRHVFTRDKPGLAACPAGTDGV